MQRSAVKSDDILFAIKWLKHHRNLISYGYVKLLLGCVQTAGRLDISAWVAVEMSNQTFDALLGPHACPLLWII